MTNTAKTSATPADVKDAKEKTGTVPPQAEATEEKTGTQKPDLTVVEGGKRSAKDRLKDLAEKAKKHKNFFLGVAVGAASASAAFLAFAKDKVEEVVELTVTTESAADEDDSTTDEPVA